MWTPNMGSKPVVTMLAHPSAQVTDIAVSRCGRYLATAGKDSKFKIFDIRNTYQSIHTYFSPGPANTLAFSDTGLLALGFANEVHLWKQPYLSDKQKAPYMKHRVNVNQQRPQVTRVRFIPYEDVLGVSHDLGYSSIVVPGAGEATFDAFEANPYQTSKQRQEHEVQSLLQKLQPESISLQVETIGRIDNASEDVKKKEAKEQMEQAIDKQKKKDKKKNKARGKGKIGREMENKTHVLHEQMREKNKLLYKREYERNKKEQDTLGDDLEFLTKIEDKFDPIEAALKSGNKRKRMD
jgi:U3 small nucleolar RNA-associated protein 7